MELVTVTKSHFGQWAKQNRPVTMDDLLLFPFAISGRDSKDNPLATFAAFAGNLAGVDAIKARNWGDETYFKGSFLIPSRFAPKGLRNGPNYEKRATEISNAAGLIVVDRKTDPGAWFAPFILEQAERHLSGMILSFNVRIVDSVETSFKRAAAQWSNEEFQSEREELSLAQQELSSAKEKVRKARQSLHEVARNKLLRAVEEQEPELFSLVNRETLATAQLEQSFFL